MQKRNNKKTPSVNVYSLFLCFSLLSLTLQAAPVPDDTQLAVWANEAIVATYSYDYQNFLARQKEIATYFSAKAWIAYSKALNDSKLPDTIQKNSYFISAVATAPPEIKSLNGNQWEAKMPLLVIYKNPQYQQSQTLAITLDFSVAPSGQGVRGLIINSFKAEVVTPLCKCPPNNTN